MPEQQGVVVSALSTPSDQHTPRQIRHLDYISQFTTDIRYVCGASNSAADALSCITANGLQTDKPPVINFEEMATAQQQDAELLKLQSSPYSLILGTDPPPSFVTSQLEYLALWCHPVTIAQCSTCGRSGCERCTLPRSA